MFEKKPENEPTPELPENPAEETAQENLSIPLELLEYKEKYLRALADTENLRKRSYKELKEATQFATENTISEFLPLIDNFENALKFSKQASDEVQQWAMGFQMILTQIRDILHDHGIIAFHSEGNLFDPHLHEVLEIVETDQYPEGTIIEEFSKGFKCGSRILRPARVKIAKKIETKEEESLTDDLSSTNDEDEYHDK